MTQEEAIKFILESPDGAIFPTRGHVTAVYRTLVKLSHPDKVTDPKLKGKAEKAFNRLTELYRRLTGKSTGFTARLIGGWVVEEPITAGCIADLYLASSKDYEPKAVFKIARLAKDNDLMKAEADALTKLNADKRNEHFKVYIPKLYATFLASGRRVNVMTRADGYHSLLDIMGLFEEGIDFRHIVWMGNRLMSALGFAHKNGIVHGAILPQHLLYHPATHALLVVGWGQCVQTGRIRAIVEKSKFMYPKEVIAKRNATPATDVFMAMQTLRLAADTIPKRFQPLFDWCQAESPNSRPQDIWDLQDRWRALAKEEYGKPKYLELKLPVN